MARKTCEVHPDQRITEIFVWMEVFDNGAERVMSGELDLGEEKGIQYRKFVAHSREKAEAFKMVTVRTAVSDGKPPVRIELRAFTIKKGGADGYD